jgi:tetratricopeptide (TPR) repeat protein
MIKNRLLAAILLSMLLLAGVLQNRYDSTIHYLGERSVFVSLPSGKALRVLSFGYQNLVADLLFIWSIQFYSTYYLTNRFDYLERVYDTITDITPPYKEPYIIGALIMAFEAKDIPMALRLLDKGSRNLPDEWFFDHEAGYYCYKYLKDIPKAEAYYSRAAEKPNAPSFLKRMKAHMVYLQDDPKVAYQMWIDIYDHARDRLERDAAFNHLYQIKAEIDLPPLQEKVTRFRDRYRRFPATLDELVSRGMAAAIPRDFSGNDYRYDPMLGTVKAQRVYKWKRR